MLARHVIAPIASRLADAEHGGFLTDFDARWRAHGAQEKSLEHAARTTIVFALLARTMPDAGYERLARHGCDFLRNAMWDATHGGFYARVDRAGRPLWEGLKHPHAVFYTARAFRLAAPFLDPGEGETWAGRALAWLNDVAWDEKHGGYWGCYRRDNRRYDDGAKLPTPDGRDVFGLVPGVKEINSQGDAIEMLGELAADSPGGSEAKRFQRMVELVAGELTQPGGVLPYRYLRNWRPSPDLLRVGYQFMMARHLMVPEAASFAGAFERAREMVDFALRSCAHPAGGYSLAVAADGRSWPATGPSADLRQWWVQIEAVFTLHLLAGDSRLEPEARAQYAGARDRQWNFFQANFCDEEHGGILELPREPWARPARGLRRLLGRQSRPAALPKAHCWKDVSHETWTLLALGHSPRAVRAIRSAPDR